ncbi:MAG: protein-glutamate O-methyltransferase family protein [Chloroflexi bacterium]|nr:protein-glutamate O-methyltransferase family protein [Chloroflexota bacterium]
MNGDTLHRPAPLRMDNDFGFKTMAVRVPAILRDVQAMNPDYSPAIMRSLDRLYNDLTANAPIPMLEPFPAPGADHEAWQAAYDDQRAKIAPLTWQHNEWFFAETFFYRHLMQAVRWFETRRDPFAPHKQTELSSAPFDNLLEAALAAEGDLAERLRLRLAFALWGNRVDLSHQASELAGEAVREDDLLVDDRGALLDHLLADGPGGAALRPGAIHLIADNAGSELAMDLLLIDLLLEAGAETVVLHLKWHPTYVSDAMIRDAWAMIDAFEARGGAAAALAGRLRAAWQSGRFRLATHPYWTSGRFLFEMPPALHQVFEGARLVILKGDANYRRAAGDGLWGEGTSFAQMMDYFPAPFVALRTLKSDVSAGLPVERVRRLDADQTGWRITGRYGVIQFAPGRG